MIPEPAEALRIFFEISHEVIDRDIQRAAADYVGLTDEIASFESIPPGDHPMIAPKKKPFTQHLYACQLKITLCDSKPTIWRRLQAPNNIKLNRLHDVLQVVMGWTDSHLHQFHGEDGVYTIPDEDSDPEDYDERQYTLADIAFCEKDEFVYEYDFGDGWEHEVLVEAHLPPMERGHAVCKDGKNACPPEDCGGIGGYYEFLKAIRDPEHEDHQQMLDWIGGSFDPKHFDIQKVNARLRRMKF